MVEIVPPELRIGFQSLRLHPLPLSARDSPVEDLLIDHGFVCFGGKRLDFEIFLPNFVRW